MAEGGWSMDLREDPNVYKRIRQYMLNNLDIKTLPALAFVAPYHEMLMRDLLLVDGLYSVKTRRSNWNYRGPVLLYTSKGKPHYAAAKAHNLDLKQIPSGVVVGIANLIDSRLLTSGERFQMLCNFNNATPSKAIRLNEWTDNYIEPLPYGVFLRDVQRFESPVPFKPKRGAIGICRVPMKLVARPLKQLGAYGLLANR